MTTRQTRNQKLEDEIAKAAGYADHEDAVAHLGNKCRCPWSTQAGCRYSDGTGKPNDIYALSNCQAPREHRCEFKVYRDVVANAAKASDDLKTAPIAPGTMCYFVQHTVTDEDGNYKACIAIEGEQGYHLTDWTWGKDYKIAEKCAHQKNQGLGVEDITALRIVLHTMQSVKMGS